LNPHFCFGWEEKTKHLFVGVAGQITSNTQTSSVFACFDRVAKLAAAQGPRWKSLLTGIDTAVNPDMRG
jgi:hypothetical protein